MTQSLQSKSVFEGEEIWSNTFDSKAFILKFFGPVKYYSTTIHFPFSASLNESPQLKLQTFLSENSNFLCSSRPLITNEREELIWISSHSANLGCNHWIAKPIQTLKAKQDKKTLILTFRGDEMTLSNAFMFYSSVILIKILI